MLVINKISMIDSDTIVLEPHESKFNSDLKSWQVILLISNTLLGVILLEWAWAKTSIHRQLPHHLPDLDKRMASFRRLDVHRWRKWQFYPGAMTLLVPRLIMAIFLLALLVIVLNILLIGHDRSRPIPDGARKRCLQSIYYFVAASISIWSFWTWPSTKYVTNEEVGFYEEYLGTREEQAAE